MNQHEHDAVRALELHIKSHMTKLRIMIGLCIVLLVGFCVLAVLTSGSRTQQIIMAAELGEHEVAINAYGSEIHALHDNAEKINQGLDRIEEAIGRIDKKIP